MVVNNYLGSAEPFKLSIVLSTHPAQFEAVAFKGDLDANLARIASWGYAGVELAVRDPGLVNADRLEKALADTGLLVPAIGTGQAWGDEGLSFTSPDPAIRKAAIDRIKSQVEFARRLNALVIIGLIRGVTPPGQTREQSMRLLAEGLQECLAAAAQQGVQLAVEPLNRYETDLINSSQEGLDFIRQVGSPLLGLLLDTFHMNIEEAQIESSIQRAGNHIYHFHVADSNRWHAGGGHLNFSSILQALHSTGYKGWISGEFMPVPDADTAAQRNIAFLHQILRVSKPTSE